MSRIVRQIQVEGRSLNALFDTGPVRPYITAGSQPAVTRRSTPISVAFGGRARRLDDRCDFPAVIDGLEFDITAYVIDELGETEFGRLDVIIGAPTMEEWWIKLDPHNNELDLSSLRRREFTEFATW